MPIETERRRRALVGALGCLVVCVAIVVLSRSLMGCAMLVVGVALGWSGAKMTTPLRGNEPVAPLSGTLLLILGFVIPAAIWSDPASGIVEIVGMFAGMSLMVWRCA
jgi:hypothetical protein